MQIAAASGGERLPLACPASRDLRPGGGGGASGFVKKIFVFFQTQERNIKNVPYIDQTDDHTVIVIITILP
jgi:hypothetical protein